MRLLVSGYSLVLLALVVGGCKHESVSTKGPHDPAMRTYQQWRDSATFPYVASETRRAQIAKNFDRLEVGSTMQDFVVTLGEPDYEQEMYPKEPNRPCLGYALVYFLEKPVDSVNKIRDKRIEAFFSPVGKAIWITSNISGLTDKGSPTRN